MTLECLSAGQTQEWLKVQEHDYQTETIAMLDSVLNVKDVPHSLLSF
jgi:hypothetical protein